MSMPRPWSGANRQPVVGALLNRRSCRSFSPALFLARSCRPSCCVASMPPGQGREPWHPGHPGEALLDGIAGPPGWGCASRCRRSPEFADNPDFHCFYTPRPGHRFGDGSPTRVDCANVVQNMCVAAHSLDIGSCYNGFFIFAFRSSRDPERKPPGIPEGFSRRPVALGYRMAPCALCQRTSRRWSGWTEGRGGYLSRAADVADRGDRLNLHLFQDVPSGRKIRIEQEPAQGLGLHAQHRSRR